MLVLLLHGITGFICITPMNASCVCDGPATIWHSNKGNATAGWASGHGPEPSEEHGVMVAQFLVIGISPDSCQLNTQL